MNVTELIERLRHNRVFATAEDDRLRHEAADALEAQAREIAHWQQSYSDACAGRDALKDRLTDSERAYDWLASRYNEQARAESEHCKDCCCARSWKALGITSYTGRSIPEEIEALRSRLAAAERPCKTYDKDGKLLTVCHDLVTAERERDEAVALLREESYEQYRFTQMTEYPSVTRMLLWHMDRRRRIDAFLAKLEAKP